jgi:hypothetical protein
MAVARSDDHAGRNICGKDMDRLCSAPSHEERPHQSRVKTRRFLPDVFPATLRQTPQGQNFFNVLPMSPIEIALDVVQPQAFHWAFK